MRTLAHWLVSIDTACCLHMSLVQHFKEGKQEALVGRLKPKKCWVIKENKAKVRQGNGTMKKRICRSIYCNKMHAGSSTSLGILRKSSKVIHIILQWPGISIISSCMILYEYPFSSLLFIQALVFPSLFSLFPSFSYMSGIIVVTLFFNLNFWIATCEVTHSAILKSCRWKEICWIICGPWYFVGGV